MSYKFNPLTGSLDYYEAAAAGSGDMILASVQTVTGAKTFNAGTLLDKGSQVFNVKAYGAVGDGSTDDTAAIQAAENAANTAGGGRVYFPTGTYISQLITKKSLVSWFGDGSGASILKLKASQNTSLVRSLDFATLTGTNSSDGITAFSIKDMGFAGNSANNTYSASRALIQIYGYYFTIEDCTGYDFQGDGLYTEWSNLGSITGVNNQMECYLGNLKFHDNLGYNYNIHGPHDGRMFNCIGYSKGNSGVGNFNFAGYSDGFLASLCHSWGTFTGSFGVILGRPSIHWVDGNAETVVSKTALQILENDCVVQGGIIYCPGAVAGTALQMGDGSHNPTGVYVDTQFIGATAGSVNFVGSGGFNTLKVVVQQPSGAVVTGAPANTDTIHIITANIGGAMGNVPQRNGSVNRMQLPDPTGTAGWYKLGTWNGGNSTGIGGNRLRIVINGTGGYDANTASVGRTIITAATGNGTPTPNAQGVWYIENGAALLDSVKLKKGADVWTWDVFVHLLATYTGNSYVEVDTGSENTPSTFIYDLTTDSDPGSAGATVAVLTEQFKMVTAATLQGGATVNNGMTVNGNTTLNDYTQINDSLDVLGGNLLVKNTGTIAAGTFVGVSDGNQYSNFQLADNVYPLDATGHYWAFSHRASHDFLIFNYNGASTYTNVMTFTETGNLTLVGTTTARTIIPSANATYTLGDSSHYYTQLYATRHYLNSTAYLDGASAGVIGLVGEISGGVVESNVFVDKATTQSITLPAGRNFWVHGGFEIGATHTVEIPATSSLEVDIT